MGFLPSNKFPIPLFFCPCLQLPNNSKKGQKAIVVEFARSTEEISL